RGVPAGPTNLTPTRLSGGHIQLSWQDNANHETRYEIFRGTSTISFVFIAQVGADVTNFTNTGLAAGATWSYRVRAVNASGNSAWSNIATATVPSGPTTAPPPTVP